MPKSPSGDYKWGFHVKVPAVKLPEQTLHCEMFLHVTTASSCLLVTSAGNNQEVQKKYFSQFK